MSDLPPTGADRTGETGPVPDNEGLPPGYVPAWTLIATEDGVVEYAHPAGEALDRVLEKEEDRS